MGDTSEDLKPDFHGPEGLPAFGDLTKSVKVIAHT